MEYLTALSFFFKQSDGQEYSILDALEKQIKDLKEELEQKRIDLIDQQNSRREWQKRALEAEQSLSRNQFAVLLVDGDGYIFKDQFLVDGEKGAIAAANQLCDSFRRSVLDCRRPDDNLLSDLDIVIRIYVNKKGLAGALVDAGIIPNAAHLDAFLVKLTQSRPLLDVVDCGGGKERVDDKIREQYRHYAYNAQCRHISIACCHDSGYVAFLDKFQGDPLVEQKTSLFVAGPCVHNSFTKLGFRRIVPAQDVFRDKIYIARPPPPITYVPRALNAPSVQLDSSSATGNFVSSVAMSTDQKLTKSPTNPAISAPSPAPSSGRGSSKNLIPVNRFSQRVDIPLPAPSDAAMRRLRIRTKDKDLCAEFHLRGRCPRRNTCPFDHSDVAKNVKKALQVALRAKACKQGLQCRQAGCYYGHHCPVIGCNGKEPCEFVGMHGIEQKVAKYVPATQ